MPAADTTIDSIREGDVVLVTPGMSARSRITGQPFHALVMHIDRRCDYGTPLFVLPTFKVPHRNTTAYPSLLDVWLKECSRL